MTLKLMEDQLHINCETVPLNVPEDVCKACCTVLCMISFCHDSEVLSSELWDGGYQLPILFTWPCTSQLPVF